MTDVLLKIHEDLEVLKRDMAEIKEMIKPKVRAETIYQVKEARKRVAKGEYASNEDILKEFDVE